MLRSAAFVLLAAVALPAQAPAYRGKYAQDPAFAVIAGKVEPAVAHAMAEAKRRLGLEPQDRKRIAVVIEDARAAGLERLVPFEGPALETSGYGEKDGRVTITIRPEFLVSGRFDLRQEMTHEMVHAVMRERMSTDAYRALPEWVREGLAVWCAGQTEARFLDRLIATRAFREPSLAILGLGASRKGFERYGEYGMAFEHLAASAPSAPQKFVALLMAGSSAEAALKELTKGDAAAFVAAARASCEERARASEPPGYDDFLAIVAADKERRYGEVIERAERFLGANAKSPLVADVLYWHGKACRLAKKPERGEKSLLRLIGEFASRSSYVDEAHYQLASTDLEARRWDDALKRFERILRDIPDASNQDRILFRIATCQAELGRAGDAKSSLDLLERSFPKSTMLDEAAALRKKL